MVNVDDDLKCQHLPILMPLKAYLLKPTKSIIEPRKSKTTAKIFCLLHNLPIFPLWYDKGFALTNKYKEILNCKAA